VGQLIALLAAPAVCAVAPAAARATPTPAQLAARDPGARLDANTIQLNSSATNWDDGTNTYKVILHCTASGAEAAPDGHGIE
jgi:hypothetical protein